MNSNLVNKRVMYFLILVIISLIALLGISILNKIKIEIEFSEKVEQAVNETGWPTIVPIIKNSAIQISKSSDSSWYVSINEPVSYDDYRNYLLELYDKGFKPVLEMGAKSPKLLSMFEPQNEDILIWAGQNEEYTVETFWKKELITNEVGSIIDGEYVTILLYSNFEDEKVFLDNEQEKSGDMFSDDELLSGENVVISTDNSNNGSGDILEDVNEGKKE